MNAVKRMMIGMIVGSITGAIGVFCAVMGVLTAADVVPLIGPGFTGILWLLLSAVIFLALIAGTMVMASKEMVDMLG